MRKKICIIIILSFLLLYSLPPIMFANGAPIIGNKSDFYPENPLQKTYYSIDFENFYVLNFRFWEELKINRIFSNDASINVRKIFPILYTINHTPNKIDKYIFSIQRSSSKWYFEYFATPDPVLW